MVLPSQPLYAGRRTPVRCDATTRRDHCRLDDERLVADAGLILPATLAVGLGLCELLDTHVDLGQAPGRANVADKAMTLIHSALTGGSWIDDCDRLRAGSTSSVLGHRVLVPSTIGTFLRSFSFDTGDIGKKKHGESRTAVRRRASCQLEAVYQTPAWSRSGTPPPSACASAR
jgi:hypothetical protein